MFHAAHEALAYCLHASLAANIKCSFVEDFRTGVLVISTIDDSSIFVRAIQEPQSLKWSCHFYHADQPNESSCSLIHVVIGMAQYATEKRPPRRKRTAKRRATLRWPRAPSTASLRQLVYRCLAKRERRSLKPPLLAATY